VGRIRARLAAVTTPPVHRFFVRSKEQVAFYSNASKSRPLFSFTARQGLDVRAEHDVFDEHGTPLGYFRKDFGASLLRSTWHLSAAGRSYIFCAALLIASRMRK